MKKIAFLTSKQIPAGTKDDNLLVKPLAQKGLEATFVDWQNLVALEELSKGLIPVVIRSPWNYLEDIDGFLKVCAQQKPIFNSFGLIRWNIHKSYLQELALKGLPVAPVWPLEQFSFKKAQGLKLVVKPYISASSYQTVLLDNGPDAEVLSWQQRAPGNYFVQPFLSSIQEEGERSFIFFNDGEKIIFSHAAVKLPKKGDFRVQVEFGGNTQSLVVSKEEVTEAKRFVDFLNSNEWLYARVDLVYYQNQWCLGELELIEPDLYFKTNEEAPELFSEILKKRLS